MAASELALARLNEIGAFSATFDDETDHLDLDASNLLGGVMTLVQQLLRELSDCSGRDREELIALARERVDNALT